MLLANIINRHNLTVGNGTKHCTGSIPRKRFTRNICEQSAIDIVMLINDFKGHLVYMHIDEERKHVLNKIYKSKTGIVKVKEIDHNTIIAKLNINEVVKQNEPKVEVFTLKNKECQAHFK